MISVDTDLSGQLAQINSVSEPDRQSPKSVNWAISTSQSLIVRIKEEQLGKAC